MKLAKAFAFLSPYSGHILPVWILLSSAQCSPVLRPSLVICCRDCLPALLMFEPVWFIHSLYSFTHKMKKYFHTSLLFFLYVHMHLLMCIPSSLLFQKFYAIVKLDALIYQFTNDILHINGVHFFSKEFQKISLFLNYDKMSTLASVKEMVLSRERWGHNLQSHTVDNLVRRIRPVRIPLEYRSWKFLFDFSHIWCSQHLSSVLQLLVGVFLILSPDSFKLCR